MDIIDSMCEMDYNSFLIKEKVNTYIGKPKIILYRKEYQFLCDEELSFTPNYIIILYDNDLGWIIEEYDSEDWYYHHDNWGKEEVIQQAIDIAKNRSRNIILIK